MVLSSASQKTLFQWCLEWPGMPFVSGASWERTETARGRFCVRALSVFSPTVLAHGSDENAIEKRSSRPQVSVKRCSQKFRDEDPIRPELSSDGIRSGVEM